MADDSGAADESGANPNPFANLPMFGDLAKALAGQGPLNWDAARQFAALSSTSGAAEPNVDPTVRIALENLARIVEMHVRDITGFEAAFPEVTPVTRGVWAHRTLEAYRPLFTEMATSLGRRPAPDEDGGSDPVVAMMLDVLPPGMVRSLTALSFPTHFESIQRGVLQITDFIYFISVMLYSLLAGVIIIDRKKAD